MPVLRDLSVREASGATYPSDQRPNPRNLMVALGGKDELRSLLHLLSKGGAISDGNRYRVLLDQVAEIIRTVCGI